MGGGRDWEDEGEGTPGLRAGALSTEKAENREEKKKRGKRGEREGIKKKIRAEQELSVHVIWRELGEILERSEV